MVEEKKKDKDQMEEKGEKERGWKKMKKCNDAKSTFRENGLFLSPNIRFMWDSSLNPTSKWW